jgi:myo-inositol-1(or 4)-monophosphatase
MKPTLNYIQDIALRTGKIIKKGYQQKNTIINKGQIDIVTDVDKQAEEFILKNLNKDFPTHQIVAEESGNQAGDTDHKWFIDPIDGTTNFAHKFPNFCVSIAYQYQDDLDIGVVYNPITEEMFFAEKGNGAFLNGNPIHVSTSNNLEKSLLVTGFPYDRFDNPNNNLSHFNRLALQVQGIRRFGAAALDLCFVACGRVDAYWEIRLEAWDLAAGTLIAREAGANVTKLNGNPKVLELPYSVIAANPVLHDLLKTEISKDLE